MVRSLLNWLHLFLIKLPTVLQNREQQEELVRVTARLAVLSKDAVVVHEGYPQDNYADLSQKQLLEELVKVIFHVSFLARIDLTGMFFCFSWSAGA